MPEALRRRTETFNPMRIAVGRIGGMTIATASRAMMMLLMG
jgi:hypothetical protein